MEPSYSCAAWLGRVGSSEKTRCNATGRVELEAVGETVMMKEREARVAGSSSG